MRGDGILLTNVLAQGEEVHTLVDIGLIQTAGPGYLLFTRLPPLREFAVTAGTTFPFAGHHEGSLIAEDLKLRTLARGQDLSPRRYVLFHSLGKTMGLPMEFAHPAEQDRPAATSPLARVAQFFGRGV